MKDVLSYYTGDEFNWTEINALQMQIYFYTRTGLLRTVLM